ncbi:MAG: hypothetical protein HND57_16025 [Planctomycetes bacterium]|nr:hypothetical protein [Planctomycetota bacterium]
MTGRPQVEVLASDAADAATAQWVEQRARRMMPGFRFNEAIPITPLYLVALRAPERTAGSTPTPSERNAQDVLAGGAVLHYAPRHLPKAAPFSIGPAPADPEAPTVDPAVSALLLQAAKERATHWGLAALCTWEAVHEHDACRAQFWSALGFTPAAGGDVQHYRTDVATLIDLLEPLYERLVEHRRIPPGGRVIPLSDSPKGPIIQLQQDFLGGQAGALDQRLRGHGQNPFDTALSHVLVVDRHETPGDHQADSGDVGDTTIHAAHMLIHTDHARSIVAEARVVSPAFRGGWANVMLLLNTARVGLAGGYTEFRFAAGTSHGDTHILAQRLAQRMQPKESTTDPKKMVSISANHWTISCQA